jgi:hypothetical protein
LRLGETFRQVQYYNVVVSQTVVSSAIIKRFEALQAAFVTEYGMLLPPGIIPYYTHISSLLLRRNSSGFILPL